MDTVSARISQLLNGSLVVFALNPFLAFSLSVHLPPPTEAKFWTLCSLLCIMYTDGVLKLYKEFIQVAVGHGDDKIYFQFWEFSFYLQKCSKLWEFSCGDMLHDVIFVCLFYFCTFLQASKAILLFILYFETFWFLSFSSYRFKQ